MITIKDIARAVGVAPSTVARALANSPRITEEVKARVRSAADRLGYVPHSGARLMGGGQSTLIGLIIPDIENDFYATMAKTLADTCHQEGFQLILSVTDDNPEKEQQHIRALLGARPAGVIIVPTGKPQASAIALLRHVPVVQLIRHADAITSDRFVIDDAAALHGATAHLIALGHRAIAYVGGETDLSTGSKRLAGYRAALREARVPYQPKLALTGSLRPRDVCDAFVKLYGAKQPTAAVCAGARITDGVLEAVHKLGLKIPRDVSVIGFGDSPWLLWHDPPLTTIGLPTREIAIAAAAALMRSVRQPAAARAAAMTNNAAYSSTLILRSSTAFPPEKRS